MSFGRAFATLKEAKKYKLQVDPTGMHGFEIRLMPKKLFPRSKRRYHVGSEIDYLNFG